jgi:soluble lytic murein transglycosylase-like protein
MNARAYIGLGLLISAFLMRKRIMRVFQTSLPAAQPYLKLFADVEKKYGLPESMLLRMGWIESRFNKDAVHPVSKASGIMQIVPRWHPDVDTLNPSAAVPYAGKYMGELHTHYKDWAKAIAAYNWGLGNLDKLIQAHGVQWRDYLPKETKDYVAKVEQVVDLPSV